MPTVCWSRRQTPACASCLARIECRHGKNRELRAARRRGRRTRLRAVSPRARAAHLRERLQGSVAALAQAPDDAAERVSPDADRSEGAQVPGRGDGKVLLRRRLAEAEGIRGSRREVTGDWAL